MLGEYEEPLTDGFVEESVDEEAETCVWESRVVVGESEALLFATRTAAMEHAVAGLSAEGLSSAVEEFEQASERVWQVERDGGVVASVVSATVHSTAPGGR